MLLSEAVLLVHGCVPSSEGQLLCYASWSPPGVHLWSWNKAPLPSRVHGADSHHYFTGRQNGSGKTMCSVKLYEASDCASFCRCCRCLCQRCKLYVVILRSELALSSASPRLPTCTFCSLSKFKSLYRLESQVQFATFTCMTLIQDMSSHINMSGAYTGHTVDLSCLHLLHGDPTAQTWTDITSQVSLYVTHLYAIFYITHFSW